MSSTAPEPAATPPPPPLTPEQAAATIRSRQYIVLLVLVAIVGVIVSLATWCFLELTHQIQQEVYTHLPHAVGYTAARRGGGRSVLPIAGVLVALAISRLPGRGGHIPADGLATGGVTPPVELPGNHAGRDRDHRPGRRARPGGPADRPGVRARPALDPARASRRPDPGADTVVAAAGTFAALSFIFASPLIAAVILIEATGIGGPRLQLILLPGLLAAGIGSLVSIGMGSFTGLSSSAYALDALPLSPFGARTSATSAGRSSLGDRDRRRSRR